MQVIDNSLIREKESADVEIILLRVELEQIARKPFLFDLEVLSSSSLMDLHYAIQDAARFDNDHLFEFYAGRNEFKRKIVFGQDEDSWDIDLHKNDEIFIDDIYPLPKGCKLYYLFDYGARWIFSIKKQRKKPFFMKGSAYPRVVSSEGSHPVQYPDWEEE